MTFEDSKNHLHGCLDFKMRTGRFSQLLLEQLAWHNTNRTAHVYPICNQIGYLEDPSGAPFGTKPATPFNHLPLKGFWHQHWFEAGFMAKNLRNDLRSPEARETLKKMSDAVNRGDDPAQYVHELVIGGYERRFHHCDMTGEWIVFAKVESVNYYLTLGMHAEGDAAIFERIKRCATEFPEIMP